MANFKLGLATAYSTFAVGDLLYIEDVSEAAADQAKYVTIGTLDERWQGLVANLVSSSKEEKFKLVSQTKQGWQDLMSKT